VKKGVDNPHGYQLDKHGQPVCPSCKESTNIHYLQVPRLTCWACGAPMRLVQKIKFPVLSGGGFVYPRKGSKCPVCGKAMVVGDRVEQVVLNLGAMRRTGPNEWNGMGNSDLGGFMSVCTHQHNSSMPFGSVDVVDKAGNGQADLVFCSPGCLRKFFGLIADELERKMGIAKQRERTKHEQQN